MNETALEFLEKARARRRQIIADYNLDNKVNEEQVREMLAWAKEFIKAAENYLKRAF